MPRVSSHYSNPAPIHPVMAKNKHKAMPAPKAVETSHTQGKERGKVKRAASAKSLKTAVTSRAKLFTVTNTEKLILNTLLDLKSLDGAKFFSIQKGKLTLLNTGSMKDVDLIVLENVRQIYHPARHEGKPLNLEDYLEQIEDELDISLEEFTIVAVTNDKWETFKAELVKKLTFTHPDLVLPPEKPSSKKKASHSKSATVKTPAAAPKQKSPQPDLTHSQKVRAEEVATENVRQYQHQAAKLARKRLREHRHIEAIEQKHELLKEELKKQELKAKKPKK